MGLVLLALAAPARADQPVPSPLTVPPALAAVTSNPEPSGLVWSPSLHEYLVVTDDAGLRSQGTNHAPWLLGLGDDGVFDATPIPIRGVAKINDPESICAGPDGTYLLVTSHSPNHRGRTAADRRQVLQLREVDRALVVLGRLDLTGSVGAGSLLALAGLPPDGRLDIEAVAYRDGSLFVGLKSPLTSRGEAVILRLADARIALREGRLREDALVRAAAVPLCLPVRDRQVCQGISDMLFLPDGSLVVSANAPKGGPKDEGGALWRLPSPLGKVGARLLHRFARRKPEGVTLSPGGHSMVVVFDRDQQAPEWTLLPLPAAHE